MNFYSLFLSFCSRHLFLLLSLKHKVHTKFYFLSLLFFVIPINSKAQISSTCEQLDYVSMENLIGSCCIEAKQKFGSMWNLYSCECSNFNNVRQDIDKIYRDIVGNNTDYEEVDSKQNLIATEVGKFKKEKIKTFNQCLTEARTAKEISTEKCIHTCENFIYLTVPNCSDVIPMSECNGPCNKEDVLSILHKNQGEYVDKNEHKKKITAIVEAIDAKKRNKCIAESKGIFLEKYTTKCKEKIEEIQQKKGNAVLLCKQGAKKEQTGCTEYCAAKANDIYKPQLTTKDLINYRLEISSREDNANLPLSHQILTSKNLDSLVEESVNKGLEKDLI